MSIKYGSSLLAGMPDVEKLLDSTSFTGTPTVPTATVGDNSKQIANTEFVQNAISNFSTSGAYKVGTRNWTYEQWKQYASTNVSTSYNPNFDIEGIKVGDIGYVYGTVSDRNNIQALMVGIVTNTDNYPTSINIQSLGLSFQNMDLIDSIMSNYAETSYVDTKISLKQDSFEIGDNLKWTYKSKNLFNMEEFLKWGGTLQEDGSYLLPARGLIWLPFDVVDEDASGKSYTLSYKVSLAPENTVDSFNLNSFIMDDAVNGYNNPPSQVPVVTKDSFVTVTNTITYPDEYINPCISTYPYYVGDETITLIIKDFQVEEGSVATDYVPYVQNTTLHAIVPTETTVDNTSISYNDDNNLQVNGVVERNKGIVNYDWVGTLSEYQEQDIENQHPEWICYITDDNDIPSVSIDSYTKEETDELLDEKANVADVYTKTETDELLNVASNDSEKTNCITEIPQDINLELVDGTLTLKTGSKVYVPNGFEEDGVTPKFDVVMIESDVSFLSGAPGVNSNQRMLVYNVSNNSFGWQTTDLCKTTSSSETFTDSSLYYNTSTNVIKVNNNQGSGDKYSLPICLFTAATTAGVVDTLDQVFNGFGYIGSTVFYLPNVQGKTANGLNSDGTYKGTDFTTTNVVTRTFSSGDNGDKYFAIKGNLAISYNSYEQVFYDKKINQFIRPTDSSSPIWDDVCLFGLCTMTKGVISNFRPYSTLQAIDRNDTSWLSGLSIPSDRCIDLTLGASGSSYTAPANGWVLFERGSTSGNKYISLYNNNSHLGVNGTTISGVTNARIFLPVKKGDIFKASYSADTTNPTFRFHYAEGEN